MAYTTLYFGSSPMDASADLIVKRDFISDKYNLVFESESATTSSNSYLSASSEDKLQKFLREDLASIQSLRANRKNAAAVKLISKCKRYSQVTFIAFLSLRASAIGI